jgi:membrane protein DedA with SNARE-associated domain
MGELSAIVMQFPYPGLFCLLILGSVGFPFPEDAILLSCGFLISRQIVAPLPAFIVVYAGIMIGDFIIYSFGRKYGRAVVTHKRFRRLLPPEKLYSIEKRFGKFGVLSVLVGRQIIGVRAQTMLAAGVLRMPLRTFLLTDAFASSLTIMIK